MTEHTLKIENPIWWKRRSRTEKCLLLIIGVLILLIIIVLSVSLSRTLNQDCDVCLTSPCIKTASQILEKIDLNVDPCDDFYSFACGNLIKNTVVPEDKPAVSSFTIVEDEVQENMHNLLKKPITEDDIKAFVLAKTYYQACMNTTEIEANSLSKFKRLIKITGGWPVVEDGWKEDDFDWISTSYKMMTFGMSTEMFLNFRIYADISNSSRNALYLDQLEVPYSKIKRNGFNETVFQAYYKYMTKIAVAFGADEPKATEEMKMVAELIIALTRITLPAEERRNATLENNPMTIMQLENTYDYVPWLIYINTMMDPFFQMDYQDTVIVKVPSYYEKLNGILKTTPKRTLANYMFWTVFENSINYLNDDLRRINQEFMNIVTGVSTRPVRWKECIDQAKTLYIASGALYVRNFFNKESKQLVTDMVTSIKDEFISNLENVDWMDDKTKKQATQKAKSLYLHMAYPDELLDDQKVENYYKNLSLDSLDYLGCRLNLTLFAYSLEYPELKQKLDKKDWRNHAYVVLVQAYYDVAENSIEFLAGVLRNVFFDARKPKYMNYGAIGHIIGHEITHGFDDEGRQFDEDGNLVDWWETTTKESFDKRTECMINQYGNITDAEVNLNLNGINTQGENIADNAGIKLAYLAYRKWSKKHGSEVMLPGLSYSPEQMFWISVAHTWCEVHRSEYMKLVIREDTHAPSRYRVNVPLMNSKEFSRDFKCGKGSSMNPEHKCHVW